MPINPYGDKYLDLVKEYGAIREREEEQSAGTDPLLTEEGRKAIKEFVKRVNARAESNMEKTGVLEGAHYAAMKAVLAEFGIEAAK